MESYRPQFEETVEAEPNSSDSRAPRQERDSLAYAAHLLWVRRTFLGHVTRNGVLLAVLLALLLPNRYKSTTRLMPPEQSMFNAALLSGLAARAGMAMPGGATELLSMKSSGDLFMSILRSQTVQDALINRFDLRQVYWDRYYEDARTDLTRATDIQEERKSGVITIEVTDRSRQRSAAMARAYVEELDRAVAQLSTSSARRERIFLEGRLSTVKQDLDNSQRHFAEFASKNATLDIKEQTKAMVGAAAVLQGQIIAAKSEVQGLEQVYTPNNVRVRASRQRIAELERQLKQLGGASETVGGLPSDKPIVGIYPDIRQLPILGVDWADLYREVKVQETVYELLTQQYELARIQEAKEIPSVRVLDPAQLPERKSSPRRLLFVAVVALLCLLFGSMWILGDDYWVSVDPHNPRKQVLQEIMGGVRTQLSKIANFLFRRK
jgi:uncharacterized protein involved in exopolysaccharide biosynthesis